MGDSFYNCGAELPNGGVQRPLQVLAVLSVRITLHFAGRLQIQLRQVKKNMRASDTVGGPSSRVNCGTAQASARIVSMLVHVQAHAHTHTHTMYVCYCYYCCCTSTAIKLYLIPSLDDADEMKFGPQMMPSHLEDGCIGLHVLLHTITNLVIRCERERERERHCTSPLKNCVMRFFPLIEISIHCSRG